MKCQSSCNFKNFNNSKNLCDLNNEGPNPNWSNVDQGTLTSTFNKNFRSGVIIPFKDELINKVNNFSLDDSIQFRF